MFDVFVGEALAVRALCESDAGAESAVVGFGVGCVERGNGVAAGYAYGHLATWWGSGIGGLSELVVFG
jgi:hypothetical protein